MKKKKVLLLVIDALSSDVFFPAVEAGKLPNFKALMAAGQVDRASTAVFPSITHCALSSLATGTYPNRHGIPGGYWFNVDDEKIVYYIGDFWTILKEGVAKFFTDLLVSLNRQQVQEPTVFELVERAGLKAACINHLIHRGCSQHSVNTPLLAGLLPGISEIKDVPGPSILFLGDLVQTTLAEEGSEQAFSEQAGLLRRYGLDDQFSADVLLHLATHEQLPDFTVAYFMDNDYESHEMGPQDALPVLEKLDARLGELFALYGGVAGLLDEFTLLVTGDHSQSDIQTEPEATIAVDALLEEFQLAGLGQSWQDKDDIVACPNMRTLQLYLAQPNEIDFATVAESLLRDDRIDQVMWRAALVDPDQRGYVVQTSERGRLHFWPRNDTDPSTANQGRDDWGQEWQWEGSLATVDASCTEEKLAFRDYPNAFERIACALAASNGGHLWATAHPGTEFQLESSLVHVDGGSHGSLHRLDSTMPLLLAGAPEDFQLPPATRTVDVLPLCLALLGVDSEYAVAASHITP